MMKIKVAGRDNEDKSKIVVTSNSYNISCVSVLPTVILHEIFLRLPIVVIMKCKLVCTSWYKLLSESTFTDDYSRNSPFHQFLFPRDICIPGAQFLYLVEISNNGDCIQTPIKPKIPDCVAEEETSWLNIIGSCNGLLCMEVCKPGVELVCVCNPLKGDYIALPQYEYSDYCTQPHPQYKFGFIPSTSNFKVVRFTCKPCIIVTHDHLVCDIFTVGVDDRWRNLTIPSRELATWIWDVSFNGVLHRISQLKTGGAYLIRTLDLAEENFGQISHPPGEVLKSTMSLRLFNNQLNLVDGYSDPSHEFTIWSMKEYGNAHSWTKVHVIQKDWFTSCMQSYFFIPVGGLKNGDLILANDNDFISFNVKQKRCAKIEVSDVNISQVYEMLDHAPSFSSLGEILAKGQREAC